MLSLSSNLILTFLPVLLAPYFFFFCYFPSSYSPFFQGGNLGGCFFYRVCPAVLLNPRIDPLSANISPKVANLMKNRSILKIQLPLSAPSITVNTFPSYFLFAASVHVHGSWYEPKGNLDRFFVSFAFSPHPAPFIVHKLEILCIVQQLMYMSD